jgi:deoxyribose-phosphate aldolase
MVIDVGALRSGDDGQVERDISAVVEAAKGRIVKTITEAWVHSHEEKEVACRNAEQAGADQLGVSRGDTLAREFSERFGAGIEI